jgi:geranylgeranyl diphosphate synthase type I
MSLNNFLKPMHAAIEDELAASVAIINGSQYGELYSMMAYHLGWEGEGAGPEARGKRIRPLLVLLTAAAARADWRAALPAAAAVELIHNFSLIHDDIEDNSPLRRGRPTVWARWGIPQAINTGDAMFTLAHLAMLRLSESVTPVTAFEASRILQEACLQLTQGQYLDIAYERRDDLTLEAYWSMVGGKTAALLAACTHAGALSAQASPQDCAAYRQFGWLLGLAFQAQDDLLGIWGDSAITGKSAESDLLSGKKSLPVLHGLSHGGRFAERWAQGPVTADEVPELVGLLEQSGARTFTEARADELTHQSLQALALARPQGEAGEALKELALLLLQRQG